MNEKDSVEMNEMYLEVLQNYLNSSEWRQSIEVFIQSNCKYFYNINEYDHQQFNLWKSFQEIVENILEMVLMNVGGSIELLENSFEFLLKTKKSSGPKEDLIKEVLHHLLTFSDFELFIKMMKEACDEQKDTNDELKGTIDCLLRMGFNTNAIDTVLESIDPMTCSIEELVSQLSMQQASIDSDNQRHHRTTAAVAEEEEEFKLQLLQLQSQQQSIQDEMIDPFDPNTIINSPSKGICKALLKFIEEAKEEEGIILDVNEFNAKFVIAESVLDSFDTNALHDLSSIADTSSSMNSSGGGILGLLHWAEQMKLLYHDILTAYNEQLPCSSMCFNCNDGLIQWYQLLEKTREELEQDHNAGAVVSNSELQRMAELDRIAALGTADEQLLHHLISRHDEVQQELNKLHRHCGIIIASERYMQRLNLEELYLYLKQQVATGIDLEIVTDNLQEQTEKVVSSSKGMEVINLLLDMHIYEEEEMMLRARIQDLTGPLTPIRSDHENKLSPVREGTDTLNVIGETNSSNSGVIAGGLLRFDDVELDGLRGLAFINMESDPIFNIDQTSNSLNPISDEKNLLSSEEDYKIDNKLIPHDVSLKADNSSVSDQHDKMETEMMKADSKTDAIPIEPLFNATSDVQNTFDAKGNPKDLIIDPVIIEAMKEQHKNALGQLKELLENERATRLQSLDDRLIRRRALLKKAKQSIDEETKGENNEEMKSLLVEHEAAVREVEDEIVSCSRSFDAMKDTMIGGFKRRCQAELRCLNVTTKTMKNDDEKMSEIRLSEEMKDDAKRSAANALKEKHRRDYEALTQSLEYERNRQRKRLMKALAAKHGRSINETDEFSSILDSNDVSNEEKQEIQTELQKMEQEFNEQESKALMEAQDRTLFALSAIYMKDELLQKPTCSDEGKYDDPEEALESHKKLASQWLSDIEHTKSNYNDIGIDLQQRLQHEHTSNSSSITADHVKDISIAAADVSQIVIEAFHSHIREKQDQPTHQMNMNLTKNGNNEENERVRRGIIEEFQNAKKKADSALVHSKLTSKQKLEERRQKQKLHQSMKDGDETAAAIEDASDLFECVMTGFIDNRPLAASTSSQHHSLKQQQFNDVGSIAERTRIKNEHIERERQLLNDLQNNMMNKKKNLEDRLKKRRAADEKRSSHDDEAAIDQSEHQIDDVKRLEEAFTKVANMIKDVDHEVLAKLDMKQLLDIMDKAARGENVSITALAPPKVTTNATIYSADDSKNTQQDKKAAEISMLPPIQGKEPLQRTQMATRVPLQTSPTLDKVQMAGEVQRISMQYNEEQQKHELMMKIQQTRQRQALQRKLMEKNQAKARSNNLHGGAGYSSAGDIGHIPREASKLASAGKDSVLIGKGGATIQRTNLQPVFKGLPSEAYNGGEYKQSQKTDNSAVAMQRNMTARGLNLAPMQGRK